MAASPPRRKSALTLQESLLTLQQSVHLGVVTANLDCILDANDAFLRMVRYTREELDEGLIDWRAMTPPDSLERDAIALEQLRTYGASVPFEKEYILRDGTRLPMMMGAIRLTEDPLEWMCYVIDLTDRRRAESAERQSRELQAKSAVVNQIAHELNNPLAALTLLVSAVQMQLGSTTDENVTKMLRDAEAMIGRITALTRAVLAAGAPNEKI